MSTPKTILVPTDFSEAAEAAVRYAFALAEPLSAHVHLLHVYLVPPLPDGMAIGVDVLTPLAEAAEKALRREMQPYRGHPSLGGVHVEMGEPSAAILAATEKLSADLVVMGSHGRRGFKRLLLGSVAESVLRAASCPVLIVRRPPPASDDVAPG